MLRVDGIVTTDQAARLVGVTPSTVRKWVARGWLEPIRRGARPLKFRSGDVIDAADRGQRQAMHARLDTLWDDVLASGND